MTSAKNGIELLKNIAKEHDDKCMKERQKMIDPFMEEYPFNLKIEKDDYQNFLDAFSDENEQLFGDWDVLYVLNNGSVVKNSDENQRFQRKQIDFVIVGFKNDDDCMAIKLAI